MGAEEPILRKAESKPKWGSAPSKGAGATNNLSPMSSMMNHQPDFSQAPVSGKALDDSGKCGVVDERALGFEGSSTATGSPVGGV